MSESEYIASLVPMVAALLRNGTSAQAAVRESVEALRLIREAHKR